MSLLPHLPTSLRARLALAFLVLVALVLFVGVASYRINGQIRARVSSLRSSHLIDLRNVDLQNVGLEFEGFWNPSGSFVATDVEILPGTARPRLRGAVEEVDPEAHTFTLYGQTLRVTKDTELDGAKGPFDFAALHAGRRIEVTCEVTDSGWEASKISLERVKASDKVKGTVSSYELDGVPPDSIDMHGLHVLVEPVTEAGPESALGRIERATQMILALQECRSSANELVGLLHAGTDAGTDGEREPGAPGERLVTAAQRFAQIVAQARSDGDDPTRAVPRDFASVLANMAGKLATLHAHVLSLRELSAKDPARAAALVDSTFEPFLQEELLPPAYAYLSAAEDDLGDELRAVLDRTDSTTRIALGTSVVAVIVALGLGFLMWRSIHRPIRVLHDAALRLGQGHFDTRISLDSHDEFGVLASAFNRMASELASTTVSMESLESVFDSMAAALIVFDPDGHIINVNRPALDLLGRERAELIGETFDILCRFSVEESGAPVHEPGSGIPAVEKVFVRKDGSEFPVSFSGAELRSSNGPLQGYVCVAQDLTEQKRIQERLRESLDEKELLLREVHHRVKNNMQVISSLLAMQSDGDDPEVAKTLQESQNRIRSIALIHEQLYRSTELAHIHVRDYLQGLTSQLLQSFGKGATVRLELETDDIELDIDQSMACGLIVNELVTNALKYAYPGEQGGRIHVGLREHPGGERVLTVADDGPGLPAEEGANKAVPTTLGMSLVRTLARQLRGRVEIDGARGTVVRVFFGRKSHEALSS